MKKYILDKIVYLKMVYPGEKIGISNGFLGIINPDGRVKGSTYLGLAYWEIDGVIYTDYNTKNNKSRKLLSI